MDLSALQHLLGLVPGRRVACVGDLMVDRFVYGEVSRLSPEAPIPVLARTRETVMLGAAGNVARNVAALGGSVALVGLIGGDPEGHEALRLTGEELLEERLEQGDALSQDLRLIAQAGDRDREMQQHPQHEAERDDEQRVRRIGDAELLGEPVERPAPDGQGEQHDAAEQPQQGIALEQPATAHEIQYADQQHRILPAAEDRVVFDTPRRLWSSASHR